jgi:glycerophosphoryl diester phosphodiesterase
VIAHRGAAAHAPENTLASFKAALSMGAKSVEFDIQQTQDGELVVIHDPTLGRLADLRGRVSEMTWGSLKQVDVGRWFDARFEGERVPKLDAVFDLLLGKSELHIEIKEGGHAYPGIEKNLLELVKARRCSDSVRISSFDHPTLFTVRELDPKIRIGYLLGSASLKRWPAALAEATKLKAASLDLSRRLATKERVQEAHQRGFEVNVYTVNDPKELRRFESFGVDAVFSDHPELSAELSKQGAA